GGDMANGMLGWQTRLTAEKGDLAAKVIDGEAIIINLANGIYYSMDGAGALVWDMIQQRASLGEIVDAVGRVYDAPRDRLEPDLQALAATLMEEQLVVLDETGQAAAAPSVGARETRLAYEPPKLVRYADMAHFFALDPPLPEIDDAAAGV